MGRWLTALVLTAAAVVAHLATACAADDALVAAAKREGQLTWYTTQRVLFADAAAAEFEKQYGIEVKHSSYNPDEVTFRVMSESRAGSMRVDLFDGTQGLAELKKQGMVMRWVPASASRLPSQYVDPNRYWVATNLYLLSPVFNTNLISERDAPRSLQDFLDPKWKGKIVWSSVPAMTGAIGTVALALAELGNEKGQEFLKGLANQELTQVDGSPAALNQVVIGEFALAPNMFSTQIADAISKGAPIKRISTIPAVALFAVAALPIGGPHPNAAKLFLDFLVSPEGQKLYASKGYTTADPTASSEDAESKEVREHAHYFTPDQIAEMLPNLVQVYHAVFQ